VPVPYCLDDCGFVVEPEVRQVDSSSSILLSQDCFGYLKFFVFPYKLWNYLFFFFLIGKFLAALGLHCCIQLSPLQRAGATLWLWCMGFSLWWPLLLCSKGSWWMGSVVVGHGPSCPVANGIFPDQGSNPCPLHWQADS